MERTKRRLAVIQGFTLVEIAIVLTIVGMLIAGLTGNLGTLADKDRQDGAADYLQNARQALLDYAGVNGYLPCPDNDDDGIEDRGAGGQVCDDWQGRLPWLDLGLKARSDWDQPVRYVVHLDAEDTTRCPAASPNRTVCFFDTPNSFNLKTPVNAGNALEILDGTGAGAEPVAERLLAVLVGYGSNSARTWADCATGGRSAAEDENCDADRNFVLEPYQQDAFDDQLVWIEELALKSALVAETTSGTGAPAGAQPALPVTGNPYAHLVASLDESTEDDPGCTAASQNCRVGSDGNDTMQGDNNSSDPDDIINGGRGNDVLFGGDGDDWIYGGPGNDDLYGEAGDDVLSGGSGNDDMCDRRGRRNSANSGGGPGDDLVWGGSGNDHLCGNAGDDILVGGTGNDWLYGNEDSDILIGGPGNDNHQYGGSGDDYFIYTYQREGDSATAIDGNQDSMDGEAGHDTLWLFLGPTAVITFKDKGNSTVITASGNLPAYSGKASLWVDGDQITHLESIEAIEVWRF
ncbi:MAG: prepilin-type N-terminal cleavage/methylation domain-containing protein [Marinobacterium sp.]|nr:prepilin-type N-terminal cleavage/methylation domain-containing protein [Marinobacterium sp.]